ncbi:MAG: O-methyltransferase family 3 [Solirubrobacterales bacterium]|jgi:predicted O-methyltransferase YrrM|nr:O-methyltransferase family 3 [Solirubrobacterales bacterium]
MIRSEHVQSYLDALRPERDPLLAEMEDLARRDGVPIVEWETGRFLATLTAGLAPSTVLEVGTAIGYSTVHIARELPRGSKIITLERDPDRIAHARAFWERGEVADRIQLVEGDALESLEGLPGPFDLVFLDATKTEVSAYLQRLEGKLAPRCVLVVDNLLMSGEAALPEDADTRWSRDSLAAGRAAARELMQSGEWLFSLLPIGDGVGFAARRAPGRSAG